MASRSEASTTGKLFQVWAGTDACEPVTWQECKLVPKEVKFIVPEMNCLEKQELWYHEPEKVEREWGAAANCSSLAGDRDKGYKCVQLLSGDLRCLLCQASVQLQRNHVE